TARNWPTKSKFFLEEQQAPWCPPGVGRTRSTRPQFLLCQFMFDAVQQCFANSHQPYLNGRWSLPQLLGKVRNALPPFVSLSEHVEIAGADLRQTVPQRNSHLWLHRHFRLVAR